MKAMSRKRIAAILAAVMLLLGCFGGTAAEETAGAAKDRIAGWYVCFEKADGANKMDLRRGILTLEDGIISRIDEYTENEPDTYYLDPACVILPGLIDLHSHIDYNSMQLWISNEAGSQWDNRFEWRASEDYILSLKDKSNYLASHWEDELRPGVCLGDLILYFTELQAAAGGTILIQGANNTDLDYDAADSHEKIRLIRSTALADDLGREGGLPVVSVTQIYLPDAELTTEDPLTYLPPLDTSGWNTTLANNKVSGRPWLEELLDGIGSKTEQGWLIHLAEGRAGFLATQTDAYSRLEFETFRREITEGVAQGRFTAEDVRSAHIGLIHACAVDLTNPEDAAFLKEYGIGLIWSPVSNLLLYSDTPDFFRYMDDPELRIAVGSDWSPSGSKNVWDEARFAYDLIDILGQETDTTRGNLLKACTVVPAEILGEDRLGNIREGAFADLFILKANAEIEGDPAAVLNAFVTGDSRNTEATLARGRVLYGTAGIIRALAADETADTYGRYTEEDDRLFLVPALFAGQSMEELYGAYEAILAEAEVEMSRVRESEDPLYRETMEEVRETLR